MRALALASTSTAPAEFRRFKAGFKPSDVTDNWDGCLVVKDDIHRAAT